MGPCGLEDCGGKQKNGKYKTVAVIKLMDQKDVSRGFCIAVNPGACNTTTGPLVKLKDRMVAIDDALLYNGPEQVYANEVAFLLRQKTNGAISEEDLQGTMDALHQLGGSSMGAALVKKAKKTQEWLTMRKKQLKKQHLPPTDLSKVCPSMEDRKP